MTIHRRFSAICALALLAAFGSGGCGRGDERRAATGVPQVEMRTIPDPPQAGDVHVVFLLFDGNGDPLRGKSISVGASIPAAGPLPMMEVTGVASEDRPGEYGTVLTLARRGRWSLVASARDGQRVLTERVFPVDIP